MGYNERKGGVLFMKSNGITLNFQGGFTGDTIDYEGNYNLNLFVSVQTHEDLMQMDPDVLIGVLQELKQVGGEYMNAQDPWMYKHPSKTTFHVIYKNILSKRHAVHVFADIDEYLLFQEKYRAYKTRNDGLELHRRLNRVISDRLVENRKN